MIWRFWWMEVRFARDKNSSSHTSLHVSISVGFDMGAEAELGWLNVIQFESSDHEWWEMCCPCFSWMVVLEWHWTVWTENPFSVAEDVAWLIFSYVGAEIGRQRIIPWSRVKSGIFASVSRDCLSLIFEVDQISLQLKCQICRAGVSLQCIMHCSTRLRILTSDIRTRHNCHTAHTLCPLSLEHIDMMSTSQKNKPLSWHSSGALEQSARNSELTEHCDVQRSSIQTLSIEHSSDRGR